jgi:DNA-binding NtrC family response regulator
MSRPSILMVIVDEDPKARERAASPLRREGHEVIEVPNADAALAVLGVLDRGTTPIVLFAGAGALDLLGRASRLVADLEIILALAPGDGTRLAHLGELDIFQTLDKPVDTAELFAAVVHAENVLEVRREARAAVRGARAAVRAVFQPSVRPPAIRSARSSSSLSHRREAPPARRPPVLPNGLRILFVDDDELVQRAYVRLFPKQSVLLATNTELAFAEIERSAPDVIVCDLHLPGLDGFQFYEQLARSHPALASRLVFVSGLEPPPPRASRVVPKIPVLQKPFAAAEFEGAVLKLLA